MPKNYFIKGFRINKSTNDFIESISSATGFNKCSIVRWLLFRGLNELQGDISNVGGIDKLQFNLKELTKINER